MISEKRRTEEYGSHRGKFARKRVGFELNLQLVEEWVICE
jgi:hypothetical protein